MLTGRAMATVGEAWPPACSPPSCARNRTFVEFGGDLLDRGARARASHGGLELR
jgi:hypothetical protein